MTSLDQNPRFMRAEDALLTAEVNGELLGLSVERGLCYGLNAVATRIWDLLREPRSLDDLCDALLTAFDVDGDRCRSEVTEFIAELDRHGLVKAMPA